MPSLEVASARVASFSPSSIPVAVFVGGTSGIGQAMVEIIGKVLSGRVHIIIIGRNSAAAATILGSIPQPPSIPGEPLFIRECITCDASLMKNVQDASERVLELVTKVNFLILSAGYFRMRGGREETTEGLDHMMALRFHSRFKFINELLPALRKAKELGEDAKVLSILGGGRTAPVISNDLDLKNCYTPMEAMKASTVYTDYTMETLTEKEPGIVFVHTFPGMVKTPQLSSNHWLFTLFSPLINALLNVIATQPQDSGQYMWYALLDSGEGFFRRGPKGDILSVPEGYVGSEIRKAIWDYSVRATST